MKDLIVLVLAAGKSSRFWPLDDKNLVKYLGKRLIDYQIDELKRAGFSNIYIIANSQNFDDLKNINGVKIICQKGEGQGSAILSAKEYIKGKRVLVINADDVLEPSLFDNFRKKIENPEIEGLFCGYELDHYLPLGFYKVNSDNIVTSLVEKPQEGQEPSKIARIVFDYYRDADKLIDSLERIATKKDCFYELGIELILTQVKFKLFIYSGYWGILKFPWQTLHVMDYFLGLIKKTKFGKNVKLAKNTIISNNVWLDDNVRILENVKIVGPCYIGKNSIIGNNSMIRGSMIGDNCVVGFSTDITRSYIGDNSWFHSNYVGDSVISNNVSFGAGTVTANLRLDEGEINSLISNQQVRSYRSKLGTIVGCGVRVGVNTSIMPGIKIGKNSFVAAGLVLSKDVPDNFFCHQKENLVFKKNKYKIKEGKREEFRSIIK